MLNTNYKKISYILSEKPGLSGQIAFEFLDQFITSNDILKFTLHSPLKHNEAFELLMQMYNVTILSSMTNERTIVIKDFIINDMLKELLCDLGMYPNCLEISKISSNFKKKEYLWSIEFCDEILTFTYADKLIDDSKIKLIEQSLLNKKIFYEKIKRTNHI